MAALNKSKLDQTGRVWVTCPTKADLIKFIHTFQLPFPTHCTGIVRGDKDFERRMVGEQK